MFAAHIVPDAFSVLLARSQQAPSLQQPALALTTQTWADCRQSAVVQASVSGAQSTSLLQQLALG